MGLLWKTETERKLEIMNRILFSSFQNVKNDTAKLFEWISYLYYQNQQLSYQSQQQYAQIQHLQDELGRIPRSREEIKLIIDSYYSFDKVNDRIQEINARVDKLISAQSPILDNIERIHNKIENMQKPEPKANLREKILQRITKNSKTYVKNLIVSFIQKYGKISALQLRELIVEEQGLCSKSSFYRMLEEIEAEENVSVMSDGKQKHYMCKLVKPN